MITPQRTTAAVSTQIEQAMAPEFTSRKSAASTAMDKNEAALCQQRLKTLYPEVERARVAGRVAEEVQEATREALDRDWEKLKPEIRLNWDRYGRARDLELARVAKAVQDAEGRDQGLEGDYWDYKNGGAAAEARLRERQQTDGQSPGGGRPSDAPVPPVLHEGAKED